MLCYHNIFTIFNFLTSFSQTFQHYNMFTIFDFFTPSSQTFQWEKLMLYPDTTFIYFYIFILFFIFIFIDISYLFVGKSSIYTNFCDFGWIFELFLVSLTAYTRIFYDQMTPFLWYIMSFSVHQSWPIILTAIFEPLFSLVQHFLWLLCTYFSISFHLQWLIIMTVWYEALFLLV